MKTSIPNIVGALAWLALLSTLTPQLSTLHAQGSAFTYQGRLNNGSSAAGGTYNFTFSLFTNSTGGTAVAGPVTTNNLVITNGLFTVTMDFGPGVWNGATNWLEIAVETNGAGTFTTLAPRQEVTPAPYSIFTEGVNADGITGIISAGNISGSYTNAVSLTNNGNSLGGNGSGLTGVNAAALNGLGASNFWQTTGNSGTTPGSNFVGTIDNRPLELHVNGQRALRLEPGTTNGAPNVIGGSPLNYVSNGVFGATIGGGGVTNYGATVYSNSVTSDFGTVGGGIGNTVGGLGAFVGGGALNQATAAGSTIGGGQYNSSSGGLATVGGGDNNVASGPGAFVGGGGYDSHVFAGNVAGGAAAVVGGGMANFATNDYATVAGGSNNFSIGFSSTVGGGRGNIALTAYTTVPGGFGNTAYGIQSTIAGGDGNGVASGATNATVTGGAYNFAAGVGSFVGGGGDDGTSFLFGNETDGAASVIGGGIGNFVSGRYGVVGGGYFNNANGTGSFVGGGGSDGTTTSGNQATGNASVIGGGLGNQATNFDSVVAGGSHNFAGGYGAFVGGGGDDGTGPFGNSATGPASVVCGGYGNSATEFEATVGGGIVNTASGFDATVPGGAENTASGFYSFATGLDNTASGNVAVAMGQYANATLANSFIWNGFPNPAYSFQPSRLQVFGTNGISIDYFGQRTDGGGTHWIVLGDGGVQFPGQTISTWTGAYLSDSGTWQSVSDRNRKTGFEHIDPGAILQKIATLPVESWRYTNELAGVRHIGPMAQDFMASFGLGIDDKTISTLDEGGVALAAIQGLNEKVETGTQKSDARIQKLEDENADLKARLEKLEQFINAQNSRAKIESP